ncbi:MAG: helicase associated domain-containing protein [Magnetococcus sp. YQC-9]
MLPRHPKAKSFLDTGLFQELTRFSELEARIRVLATPEEQKAAFGVFIEGVLTTRTLHRAIELWPTGEIPPEAQRRLSLPGRLPGADGLYRSLEGEIHAYQLYFRLDRATPLPDEAERSLPFAAHAPRPLVITNGEQLPEALKKHKWLHALRGSDLDRLEARHFLALRRWLQGAGSAIERPLTAAAHAWVIEQLQTRSNRDEPIELHLAPGAEAGTLALKLAVRLGARRVVIVILPDVETLTHLIRQWRGQLGWGDLAVMQVTEEPGNAFQPLELDFPLTHTVDGIRRFLAWNHTGGRVILATRAAIGVLGRAMIGTPRADLVIGFDTLADPLPAARRIHFTNPVTPRPQATDTNVVMPLPRSWRLVLIPTSSPPQTLTELVTRLEGEAIDHLLLLPQPEGQNSDAPIPAPAGWSLYTLPEERSLRAREPLFTAFTQDKRALLQIQPERLGRFLPQADGVLVGKIPNATQLATLLEPLLAATHSEQPALLIFPLPIEAGRLTNNPLVWELLRLLVAWDGTLATRIRAAMEQLGRSGTFDAEPLLERVRILPGDGVGLNGETFATALLQALGDPRDQRYGELVHFCRLHGHGAVPRLYPEGPELAAWAVQMRQARQRGQLEPEWSARLEKIGFVWDLEAHAWGEELARLRRFIARQGHARIPGDFPEEPELAIWAEKQRQLRHKGKLAEERVTELEQLGFIWDLEAYAWGEELARLRHFIDRHGDARIPDPCPDDPELAIWAEKQRQLRNKGKLVGQRVEELDRLGFIWDPEALKWHELCAALAGFYARFGHFDLPKEWPEEPELPAWVKGVRTAREKGKLDPERVARLDELGFIWDARDAAWEARFAALHHFRQTRNHCLVPARWEEDPELARWVEQQRREYRAKSLAPDRIERLELLGFLWDSKAIFWEEMYAALTEYRARNGDCLVAEGVSEQSQLAWWVAAQRKARLAGQLEADRVARLEAIDFVWDAQEVIWLESFRALEAYQARFSHLLVPNDWPENPRLAAWVTAQRNAKMKGHLSETHAERLSALGMIWDPKEAVAEEMMQQLRDFRRRWTLRTNRVWGCGCSSSDRPKRMASSIRNGPEDSPRSG